MLVIISMKEWFFFISFIEVWFICPTFTTPKFTTHIYDTEIRLIIFFAAKDGEALHSQQKQDRELTVAQIMNSLLPNSDLNWRK